MQYRDKFRFLARCLLGAGMLALLLAVFQPHQHQHGAGPKSDHSCLACKAGDSLGGTPMVPVGVTALIPFTTAILVAPSNPFHTAVLLTSSPPRAPPHSV